MFYYIYHMNMDASQYAGSDVPSYYYDHCFCDSSHIFPQVFRISLGASSKTETSMFCVRNHFLVRQCINLEVKTVVCYSIILTLSVLMLSTSDTRRSFWRCQVTQH